MERFYRLISLWILNIARIAAKRHFPPNVKKVFAVSLVILFSFFNPAAAVAAIIICQDKIAFTRRAKDPCIGELDLPGGFVDGGESLEQALSREIQEELSIDISDWHYFYSDINLYPYAGFTYQSCDAVFVTYLNEFPEARIQQEEITELLWLPLSDVPLQQIAFPSLRNAVEKFIINQ